MVIDNRLAVGLGPRGKLLVGDGVKGYGFPLWAAAYYQLLQVSAKGELGYS